MFTSHKYRFVLSGRLDVPNCPLTVGFTRGLFGFEYFKGYMDEVRHTHVADEQALKVGWRKTM